MDCRNLRQFLKQPRLYFPKSTLPTHLLNFPNFLAFLSFCLEEDGFAREDCTSLVTRLIQCKLASYNFYPPPMLSCAKHFVTFVGVLYSAVHAPCCVGFGEVSFYANIQHKICLNESETAGIGIWIMDPQWIIHSLAKPNYLLG